MCIAAGVLIVKLSKKIPRKQIASMCIIVSVLGIGIFGMINLVEVITTDMTSAQYTSMSYILNDTKYTSNKIIFAGPTYSWVLDDVFHKKNTFVYYYALTWTTNPNKYVLLSDPHLHFDFSLGKQIADLYDSTHLVQSFNGSLSRINTSHYPYQNLYYTTEGNHLEIRIK
ncbi:hypothetical protein DYY66_1578 [Candidatus Nitrosotalea sp. FS]|uniref:hypothetical protein n=1 Tax=Candidatus Nitrosotalea sp. FS TaxID=2341021 RepID=UPI00140D28D2|nr:hypothetical protein [Candidatus Nitrosotalea sp. FS]NHH97877.1 hypothetical protein [Candidatus Nitrosotalea sp. FS]